jgi:CheY-like chemotaxis protein
MKVTECRAPGDLPWHMFALIIFEGEQIKLPDANLRPKVVLLSMNPQETESDVIDAVLRSPLPARLLRQKLSELLRRQEQSVVPTAVPPPANNSLTPMATGCRVLVTDDNVINQKIAAALLARMGCEVEIADSGSAAVAQVAQKEYDVVFMDCVMPGMDGFETTIAIRNLAGKLRRVPIVALTASATTEDRDKCLAAGMDDFLTKPIRIERLRECLAQWTRKQKAASC